jgi:hypothetical protein
VAVKAFRFRRGDDDFAFFFVFLDALHFGKRRSLTPALSQREREKR